MATAISTTRTPNTFSTERELPPTDWIWAFGDDDSIEQILQATPHSHHQRYGHRCSIAIIGDSQEETLQVAKDIIAYDSRGCMAPVVVFCIGDVNHLASQLHQTLRKLEMSNPLGTSDPYLGPEIRRRVGLVVQFTTPVHLERTLNKTWGVIQLPPKHCTWTTLPRLVTVVGVSSPEELANLLMDWQDTISTIGCGTSVDRDDWIPTLHSNPRICNVGSMQFPPFTRLHDGIPMYSKFL